MSYFNCEEYGSIKNRKRLLDNETIVWYIFAFLVICNIVINNMQRKALIDEDNKCIQNNILNGSKLVAIASLILYLYFFKLSYNNYIYATSCKSEQDKKEASLVLIANLLFIIAGIIAVYLESKGIVPLIPSV